MLFKNLEGVTVPCLVLKVLYSYKLQIKRARGYRELLHLHKFRIILLWTGQFKNNYFIFIPTESSSFISIVGSRHIVVRNYPQRRHLHWVRHHITSRWSHYPSIICLAPIVNRCSHITCFQVNTRNIFTNLFQKIVNH